MFATNEKMCRKPRAFIEFFLAQVAYEYEEGRLSALEMLHALFNALSQVRKKRREEMIAESS